MNDVKEYLSRYHNTKLKIQKLQALVDEYIRLANQVPGIQFDAIRVDGGKNLKAPFEKWILKALDYEMERVLILRYIDWLTWNQIADEMYISRSTVKRWHLNAISLLKI